MLVCCLRTYLSVWLLLLLLIRNYLRSYLRVHADLSMARSQTHLLEYIAQFWPSWSLSVLCTIKSCDSWDKYEDGILPIISVSYEVSSGVRCDTVYEVLQIRLIISQRWSSGATRNEWATAAVASSNDINNELLLILVHMPYRY